MSSQVEELEDDDDVRAIEEDEEAVVIIGDRDDDEDEPTGNQPGETNPEEGGETAKSEAKGKEGESKDEDPLPDSAERGKQESTPSETPQLDPKIAETLKDHPETLKAVQEAWETQVKGLEATLDKHIETMDERAKVAISWADPLNDPEKWQEAFLQLGEGLAKAHGVDFKSIAGGILAKKSAEPSGPAMHNGYPLAPGLKAPIDDADLDLHEQLGYRTAAEMENAKENHALRAELAEIKGLLKQQATQAPSATQAPANQQAADISDKVAKEIGDVRKAFAREYPDFNVSENMLKNALTEFPDKPAVQAVKLAYGSAITRFMASQAAKRSTPGPEMIPEAKATGGTRPVSAENYGFRDALREVRSGKTK